MTFPEFSLDLAPPGKMTMPYLSGGAIEGGRSMSGVVQTVNMTGGGVVMLKYSSVQLGNRSPARLRYWNYLAGLLNSGIRSILVPALTDFIAPKPDQAPLYVDTTFSDASVFSDGTPFRQPSVFGICVGGGLIGTATLVIRLYGGGAITGGEWFELTHLTRLSRLYTITDIDSAVQNSDGSTTYTVGVAPPLRDSILDGDPVRFDRPRCLMRLAPGSTISTDVEQYWWATPDITFIESFGTI